MEQENLQTEDPGILIPGERAEVEDRARGQGWVSKEEFEADARNAGKKWRPAEEFLERGEFLSTIKSLKHEVLSIKRDFSILAQHHKDVAKVEYERAIKDLKAQRVQAAEEGDTRAVVDIQDQIDELKENYAAQKESHQKDSPNAPHPAYVSWVSENSWYDTDPALRGAADSVARAYMQKNPSSPFEEVLDHVSREMSKYIQKPKPKAAFVESGSNGAITGKKAKLTEADLSEEERDVMRTFIKRGVFKNKQEYIDELAKVKGL